MSDLLFHNAGLYLPGGHVVPGALRVSDGRIRDVMEGAPDGPLDHIADSDSKRPERVDLGGGVVLPGLVDTHFHLTSLALKTLRCDLSQATSAGAVVDTLAHYAASHDGACVVGVEWDETAWDDSAYPTRVQLDAIDSKRPLLARRICGHVGVVNSVLLAKLKANAVLIDADSGLLREHSLWEANGLVAPAADALSAGIESAIAQLHKLGVTAIHDIVEPSRFEAYLDGIRASCLPLRIDVLLHIHPSQLERFDAMCEDVDPSYFRLAGVKTFLDGSLGGETAALNRPYEGSSGKGTLLVDNDDLRSITEGAWERDRMCAIHAIGDRAIDQALDALERFPAGCGRFRIEHCELVGEKQLKRLHDLRPILAMQPNFIGNWGKPGGLYEQRLGKERLQQLNPLATLKTAGLDMIFGSDGMPPGPLFGMHSAVTHCNPSERLSVHDAIDGYTHAAHSAGLHARKAGDLAPDYLADFTVVDANPLSTDLNALRVTHTIVGGRVVYSAAHDSDQA